MRTPWISIICAIGAFLVSFLLVLTGYWLFLAGAQGGFKFSAGPIGIESVAPGIGFTAAGVAVVLYALYRLIKLRPPAG